MLFNTRSDFLKTVEPANRGIICPACGSVMGIRKGSYRMVLTQNARFELNDAISEYRLFLQRLEDKLEFINIEGINRPSVERYPYHQEKEDFPTLSHSGLYDQTKWAQSSKAFIADIDYLGWNNLYKQFPRYKDLSQFNGDDSRKEVLGEIFSTINNTIIAGFEPISSVGPLMDIVFEQRYVKEWMKGLSSDNAEGQRNWEMLDGLLKTVCPSLQEYLTFLKENSPENSDGTQLKEGILRFQFYLALLLGHNSRETEHKGFLSLLGIDNEPFQLPRVVGISPELLENMIQSELLLGSLGIEWSDEFKGLRKELVKRNTQEALQLAIAELEQSEAQGTETFKAALKDYLSVPQETNGARINQAILVLKDEIHRIVDFTCPGPPSDKAEFSNGIKTIDMAESAKFCGWSPKPEKTHSVIFIGSPGTGKSTVMLSGFTAFYNNIASLDATITFDSPIDEAQMKALSSDYWKGRLPEKTEKGFRRSIKFALDFFPNGGASYRTNFVFSDIPGEKAAVSLTESGSDPYVSRILKNAEAIVFFFDLSVEASIREKIQGLGKVKENFEKIDQNRGGTADISQRQLLQKLISDLIVQRGADKLKGTKFICVIPKFDLYIVDEQMQEKQRYFFTGFCDELMDAEILVPSQFSHNGGNGAYNALCSLAGAGLAADDQDKLSYQQELVRIISDKAGEHLGHLGDAIGNDPSLQRHRDALSAQFKSIKKMLHFYFGEENVYFLPVSAQGEELNGRVSGLAPAPPKPSDDEATVIEDEQEEDAPLLRLSNRAHRAESPPPAPEPVDTDETALGYPPNQKLAEYVFISPVILLTEQYAPEAAEGQEEEVPF
jgi:hypothetical protein